ncbi:hypothetical protein WK53_29965 [Burkholderia ubonensis]|uniref:Uncharacterized protein n=1 Tax=Burkholderia ubonensis TaxID=101571 RepID=A0AAW3NII0_9BURK|nr:hypothetical protein WK53_29965 [Burkholderia ubonensis]
MSECYCAILPEHLAPLARPILQLLRGERTIAIILIWNSTRHRQINLCEVFPTQQAWFVQKCFNEQCVAGEHALCWHDSKQHHECDALHGAV